MAIGLTLFAFALGAIFAFAVHRSPAGVSLQVLGVVVMLVGVAGFVTSMYFAKWRRKVVEESIDRGEPPPLDVDSSLIYEAAPPTARQAPRPLSISSPRNGRRSWVTPAHRPRATRVRAPALLIRPDAPRRPR